MFSDASWTAKATSKALLTGLETSMTTPIGVDIPQSLNAVTPGLAPKGIILKALSEISKDAGGKSRQHLWSDDHCDMLKLVRETWSPYREPASPSSGSEWSANERARFSFARSHIQR